MDTGSNHDGTASACGSTHTGASFTPGGSPEPPSLTPQYTRQYHRVIRVAYNLLTALTRSTAVPWTVFATAMHYVHRFYHSHGLESVDPILVGAAAFFLGTKVEGLLRVKLEAVIFYALESTPGDAEYEIRKQQLAALEMALLDTLQFDLVVIHGNKRIHEIVGGDGEFQRKDLVSCEKFLAYSYHTPLSLVVPPNAIAEAIVWLIAESVNRTEAYLDSLQPSFATPAAREMRQKIQDVLYHFLILGNKVTELTAVNEEVAKRKIASRSGMRTPRADG